MIKKLAFRILLGFWPNNDDLNKFVSLKHDMVFYIEKSGFDKAIGLLNTQEAASFEIFRTRDRKEWIRFLEKRGPTLESKKEKIFIGNV